MPSRLALTFKSRDLTISRGSRLLCSESNLCAVVHDVPTKKGMNVDLKGKVTISTHLSSAPRPPRLGRQTLCFAGKDDEFVASSYSANDFDLRIWSLPADHQFGERRVIDKPFVFLKGHNGQRSN